MNAAKNSHIISLANSIASAAQKGLLALGKPRVPQKEGLLGREIRLAEPKYDETSLIKNRKAIDDCFEPFKGLTSETTFSIHGVEVQFIPASEHVAQPMDKLIISTKPMGYIITKPNPHDPDRHQKLFDGNEMRYAGYSVQEVHSGTGASITTKTDLDDKILVQRTIFGLHLL